MKPENLKTLALAALMPQRTTCPPMRWNATGEPTEPAAVTAAHALAAKVDELGALRAVIADLQAQADTIRTQLEDAGLATVQGQHYSATISQCKGKTTTDWASIAKRYKPSPQLVRAYTKQGDAYTQLKITARPTH